MAVDPDAYLFAALKPHVHGTRASDGLVFLDTIRDCYCCVYDPITSQVSDLVPRADPDALIVLLVHEGLADRQPNYRRPASLLGGRWQDVPTTARAKIRLRDLSHFAIALLQAGWRLWTRPFASLIAAEPHIRLSPRQCGIGAPDPTEIAGQFDRLCLLLPFSIQCLFRSLCLREFLARYGVAADWVFGVTLFPFHAHCWLADGDRLIGERSHRVERFVPILRIAHRTA